MSVAPTALSCFLLFHALTHMVSDMMLRKSYWK